MSLIAGPVIVPHPVIIPTGTHGTSGDLPASLVITYAVVAVLVWIIAAFLVAVHEGSEDGEDLIMAVFMGAIAGLAWPFTLPAVALWFGLRRVLRGH